MRQNAHLAIRTRQDYNINISGEDHTVLGNDFTSNGHFSFLQELLFLSQAGLEAGEPGN